jgi:hypothetical protein
MDLVAKDYADYVSNFQIPTVMVPLTLESEGDFSFRYADMSELISAIDSITSNAVGTDGISIIFLKIILPYISFHILYVMNHAKTSSLFQSFWK